MTAILLSPEQELEEMKYRLFRLEEPIVGENQEILRGGMWPSQRIWWDLVNQVRLLVGGYGSGKTIQLGKRHCALSLSHAPIPTAIVSPTYSMAKETIIPTIEDILENQSRLRRMVGQRLTWKQRRSAPFDFRIRWEYQARDGRRIVKNGKILILSGEDPRKLKGTNLGSAGIDEPFIQEFGVFQQMVFRVRHRKSKNREVNLTGTPEQLNWGYDLAEGDLAEQYDVGIVQASTLENKALPPEYVPTLLRALDAKTAQAYVHGLFVNLATGLVYYAFDRMENVVQLTMPTGAEVGVGMDFNVNPMAAAVFWYVRGRCPHIHFFDEIELPNSDTQDMCQVLRQRYSHLGLTEVYPDASGKQRSSAAPQGVSDFTYLEQAGFNINVGEKGNPARRDRFNSANGMMRPIGPRVRMTIAPHCRRLIKYFMLYSHELMNRENQKAMSHLLDAATYPVAYLFPVDKANLKLVRVRGA